MRKTSLYLHMGPGMNAEPEKAAFFKENPHVVFWNQPLVTSEKDAFEALVTATKTQIETLAQGRNKMNLIGHSFGANIVMECLRTHADLIEECQLIAPTFCMHDFLLSLLKTLAENAETPQSLKLGIDSFLKKPYDTRSFWEGHSLIIQDPNFFRCYWKSEENYRKYQLVAQKLYFDQATFKNATDQFLSLSTLSRPLSFSGNMSVHIGLQDPMMNLSIIKKNLRGIENVKFHFEENTGHFPHFESKMIFI